MYLFFTLQGEFTAFQTETKEVLHSLFPHIDIQTEEVPNLFFLFSYDDELYHNYY